MSGFSNTSGAPKGDRGSQKPVGPPFIPHQSVASTCLEGVPPRPRPLSSRRGLVNCSQPAITAAGRGATQVQGSGWAQGMGHVTEVCSARVAPSSAAPSSHPRSLSAPLGQQLEGLGPRGLCSAPCEPGCRQHLRDGPRTRLLLSSCVWWLAEGSGFSLVVSPAAQRAAYGEEETENQRKSTSKGIWAPPGRWPPSSLDTDLLLSQGSFAFPVPL